MAYKKVTSYIERGEAYSKGAAAAKARGLVAENRLAYFLKSAGLKHDKYTVRALIYKMPYDEWHHHGGNLRKVGYYLPNNILWHYEQLTEANIQAEIREEEDKRDMRALNAIAKEKAEAAWQNRVPHNARSEIDGRYGKYVQRGWYYGGDKLYYVTDYGNFKGIKVDMVNVQSLSGIVR